MNAQTQRGPPAEDEERNPAVHARDGPEQVVELSLTELYLTITRSCLRMRFPARSWRSCPVASAAFWS